MPLDRPSIQPFPIHKGRYDVRPGMRAFGRAALGMEAEEGHFRLDRTTPSYLRQKLSLRHAYPGSALQVADGADEEAIAEVVWGTLRSPGGRGAGLGCLDTAGGGLSRARAALHTLGFGAGHPIDRRRSPGRARRAHRRTLRARRRGCSLARGARLRGPLRSRGHGIVSAGRCASGPLRGAARLLSELLGATPQGGPGLRSDSRTRGQQRGDPQRTRQPGASHVLYGALRALRLGSSPARRLRQPP